MVMKTIGDIFKVMGEVNLNEIKNEAQRPFSLFLTGESTLVDLFASHLSQKAGKSGIHPWLVLERLPIKLENLRWAAPDMALLIIGEADLTPPERDALDHLNDAKVPTIIMVVNEMADRFVGANLPRKKESARLVLSTLDAQSIENKLSPVILKLLPDQYKLSLARQFPLLRDVIIHELIEKTSYANGAYAASSGITESVPGLNIPLNVADIVLLTKNQLILAYKVALAHGKEGEPIAVIGEIVGVLGQAFFFREIARQLVGLLPVIGIIPKIAVSYSGTWVIGQTTHLWAKNGEILEVAQMNQLYEDAREQGKKLAESLLSIPLGKREESASSALDQELLADTTQQKAISWQEFLNWLPSNNTKLKNDEIRPREEVEKSEDREENRRKGGVEGFLWGKRLLMGKEGKAEKEGSEGVEGAEGVEGSEEVEGAEGVEGAEQKNRTKGKFWNLLSFGQGNSTD